MFNRLALSLVLATLAGPTLAQTLATGTEITAAITDTTVTGSMSASGPYAEYYGADGSIKAKDYSGSWTVEGDKMCFDYGDGPDCWDVRIEGETVTWVKDGVDGGTGTIAAGNINNF